MARQIFEGLKVADFNWLAAGPQVGRELAEHGATVVRVESHTRLDPLRTFQPFKDLLLAPKLHNRGKLSLEKHDIRDIHSVERIFALAKPFAGPADTHGGHGA